MNGPYWIGLKFYNAQWKWVESGLEANFTYWEEGYPIDYLEPRYCVLINFGRGEDGHWENAICEIIKRILCEKTLSSNIPKTPIMSTTTTTYETVTTTTTTSPNTIPNNGCTSPWVKILDSCYLSHSNGHVNNSWDDSKKFCQEQNGYLIEVNTKEEQDALTGEGI